MKYIIAHDIGTSGNKATLFQQDGALVCHSVAAYPTDYFNHNWAEQDARHWWQAVCQSTRHLIEKSRISAKDIAAISFSGQMMGCLPVDKNGEPLRKAIIWADQRAQQQAAQIGAHISQADYYKIVGHPNAASYGIHKLMWVRDNQPDIYEKTYKTLNAKDYIVMKLTGAFYTDYSDANSMGCFDLKTFDWSDKLVGYAGIDRDKLPQPKPSTFVVGGVTADAAGQTGLAPGTPVVLGGGDGVVANVGAGSIKPGKTYCCLGTSAWVTTTAAAPIFDEGMRTVTWAHAVPGLYAPNGTMQYAGGAYSWAKNTLCDFESHMAGQNGTSPYDYMEKLVAQSPAGANGLIFLPYMIGERAPRWNPNAKGAYIGLKSETQKGDMLRSTLEGVTMNLAIILDILRENVEIDEILAIGGGARGATWRQIMADIFGLPIAVPALLEEAGAMGAAVIAGVGTGLYTDFDVIQSFLDIAATQTPNPQNAPVYAKSRALFDQCYTSLLGVFENMAAEG